MLKTHATTATILALFLGSAAYAETDVPDAPLQASPDFDQNMCIAPANVFPAADGPMIQNAMLNLAFSTWGATTSTYDVKGDDDINLSYTSRSERGFVQPTFYLHQEIGGLNHTCHISEDSFNSFEIDFDALCKDDSDTATIPLPDLYEHFYKTTADQGYLVIEHVEVDNGPVFFQTALFESEDAANTPVEDRNEDPTIYAHMMYQPDTQSVCRIDYTNYVGLKDIHWLARPQYLTPADNKLEL